MKELKILYDGRDDGTVMLNIIYGNDVPYHEKLG